MVKIEVNGYGVMLVLIINGIDQQEKGDVPSTWRAGSIYQPTNGYDDVDHKGVTSQAARKGGSLKV